MLPSWRSVSDLIARVAPFVQALGQQAAPRQPVWLADLHRSPPQPAGWGVRSAAPLQLQSLRRLCTSALAPCWADEPGAKRAGEFELSRAVMSEMAPCLPAELSDCLERELQLLVTPPQATSLTYRQLAKSMASGGGPPWAAPMIIAADADEDALPEDVLEVSAHGMRVGEGGLARTVVRAHAPHQHKRSPRKFLCCRAQCA